MLAAAFPVPHLAAVTHPRTLPSSLSTPQNPSCPICVPVKEYVQRSRNHSGTDSSDSYKQTMDQVRFA